ncbi:hypothetical protein K2173_008242 [Erythroxylum novogranatense]|uniref:Chlororespiratory reduction 41 n=1 Tax=Erythroxylum novogranatense TaxID=1862640 RepID=A0AAV8TUT8_9ROSI|nr:hypothetical protein K2173_008242 [Erythroxylum novogranatense]
MATLQKFKLLATQCGVAQSPTRSPRTSPVVHLRRRKTTLRMLLSRSSSRRSPPRQFYPPPLPKVPGPPPEKKRDTLKDLFVSSPAFEGEEEKDDRKAREVMGEGKCDVFKMKVNGLLGEPGSPRPGWIGFRHRSILRRAWRPMLAGIPENENE